MDLLNKIFVAITSTHATHSTFRARSTLHVRSSSTNPWKSPWALELPCESLSKDSKNMGGSPKKLKKLTNCFSSPFSCGVEPLLQLLLQTAGTLFSIFSTENCLYAAATALFNSSCYECYQGCGLGPRILSLDC